MEIKDIQDKIAIIISNQLDIPVSDIKPETKFRDELGVDSLDQLYIVLDIEDDFGIQVDDYKVNEMTTIKEIVDYVKDLVG